MPDGDITLSVTLSTDDIKSKAGELRKNVQQLFDGASANKLDKNLQRVYVQMDKLVSKSESITAKMREMETTKIKNPEIEKTEKELDNLYKTVSNIGYVTLGGKIVPFSEEDREKAIALQKELDGLKDTLSELMQNGSQVSLMEVHPEQYRAYASALNQCNNELTITVARAQQASEGVAKTGASFSQVYHTVRTIVASIQTGIRTVTSTFKKFGSHVKSVFNTALRASQRFASHLKGALVNALKRVSGQSEKAFASPNLKKGLNMLLKYGFGVRSLYFAFRKLRTAVKEGLENLVQYDSANNETNMAITELRTSLLFLKNAWAAAFAPIINVVMPMLTALIDGLATIGNAIARFIGALTGQTVVLNAVKVSAGDYASSLDKTGKSAGGAADKVKKLTDRLASFDDLNVLGKDNDDEDTSGGGGGGGALDIPDPSEMFEYVDAISDFADRLKKAWKNQDWKGIGKLIAKTIDDSIIKPLIDTLNWDNCKDTVMDFINQWGSIINGFFEYAELFEDIGTLIGEGITTTANTITHALRTLNLTAVGDDIFRVFKNALAEVDETAIANAISEAFLAPLRIANGFFYGKDKEEISTLFTDIGTKIATAINEIKWYDIFMGIFNFASSVGDAIIDTIIGFVDGGGFSGMLDQIANAINDAVSRLKPEDFEKFGKTIGSLIVKVLSDLNSFMDDTSESFDAVVGGVGNALSSLPWEDIFQNAGEIAVKIINAIIKVLNIVGQHMNDVQENGKTLAQNLGEVIGECISQIDFECMGNAFGLIAEGIVDGIGEALSAADVLSIIGSLSLGFEKANPDSFTTIATLAVWGTVAKAILDGVVRALPLIFLQNSSQIFGAIGEGLSKSGGFGALEGLGVGGWGAEQAAGSSGSFVAGGIADFGALATAIGGVLITLQGVSDAWKLTTGEINETDFGGINTEVVESEGVWDNFKAGFENAFSSFDQFRLTFAMGIQGIGDGFAWLGENTVYGWETIKNEAPKKWGEISEAITTKFGEAKDWVEEKAGDIKTNLTTAWETVKTNTEERWGEAKENIVTAFGDAKDWVEEKSGNIKESVSTAWETVQTNTEEKWTNVKEGVTNAIETTKIDIEDKVTTIKESLYSNWETISTDATDKWTAVKDGITENFDTLKTTVEETALVFQENITTKWEEMSATALEKWTTIKTDVTTKMQETKTDLIDKVTALKTGLGELWQDIKGAAYEKFLGLKNNTIEIFRALSSDIKAPLNAFISAIESMVNHAISAINKLFDAVNEALEMGSDWLKYMGLPALPKLSHLPSISLPRLAEGAVIPPNKEFLAVLGDQSSGTNIEAPLDTIKQAVAEVLATNNSNGEVVELLQELIRVVEDKELTIGDKEIGKANARYVNQQRIIRGTSF